MTVILKQPDFNCSIYMFIFFGDDPHDSWESSGRYVKVSTSCIFDPYPELHAWLQQIQRSELPAEVTIDEEGRGMTLVAEDNGDDALMFTIKPWMRQRKEWFLQVHIQRAALVQSFVRGIMSFLDREYDHTRWYAPGQQDLRDIPWVSLLDAW